MPPLPPCSEDDYGILPAAPQPYLATLEEVRQRFVTEAPHHCERRERIADMLDIHVAMLRRLFRGEQIRIWVNGGFITHKTWPPRDADIAVLVPTAALPKADKDAALPLWTLGRVTAQRGGSGPEVVTDKLHTGLGLTDAYVVSADRPNQVESWRRRWSAVKDESGAIVPAMTKGFVEVIEDV
ncbi:hypothetical protein SEA_HOLLIDAY_53 [Gordonia phage Holliday]|nr:hypothetical protein SEA_HOLLIDAY_53 [Gordonia phage Holliday]